MACYNGSKPDEANVFKVPTDSFFAKLLSAFLLFAFSLDFAALVVLVAV